MVRRELHYEGCGVACEHFGLFEHDSRNDDCRHSDEVSRCCYPRRAAKYSARDHCYERYFRAARYECCGHDGHAAVALVFNGARSHDTGYAAARAYKHGDEALARKPEAPEYPVENKGDSCHVSASFEKRQHEEQNEHLRNESENRAHARDYAVYHEPFEPVSSARLIESTFREGGNGRYEDAVICGVGFFANSFDRFKSCVVILDCRGLFSGFKGLLVLDGISELGCRNAVFLDISFVAVDYLLRGAVFLGGSLVLRGAVSEQVEAVSENIVVREIGKRSAHADHSNPVHREHYRREYRQTQPAVRHNSVYLVGGTQSAFVFLVVAIVNDTRYVVVALVGNYGLRVVVHFFLYFADILVNVHERAGRAYP